MLGNVALWKPSNTRCILREECTLIEAGLPLVSSLLPGMAQMW